MSDKIFNQPASSKSDSEWLVRNPFRGFKLSNYIHDEIFQPTTQKQESVETDHRGPFSNRVYTFVTVPAYLESFIRYGLLQCLDHFLILYTLLPLRCALVFLRIARHILLLQFASTKSLPLVHSHELRDLVRLSMLAFCSYVLFNVDSSIAYHEIRTQSVIKIYIFFNLLEVADRLLSAVCQDAIDDLMHSTTRFLHRFSTHHQSIQSSYEFVPGFILFRDLLLQYCFAMFCLMGHCLLQLCQVTTLNVAFNSQNKSLVTVFISNNFVELKGSVFRKMGKTNLFQIACADVRERFHYLLWLGIVVFRNLSETGWNSEELKSMTVEVAFIFIAEVIVDWIKHSFITKFNVIPANVYDEYSVSIAYDLLLCRQGKNQSDHFDLVSRRMGLTPIPLACLLNVMLLQTVRTSWTWFACTSLLVCTILFFVKIGINLLLMSVSYRHVMAYIKTVQSTNTQDQTANGTAAQDTAADPAKTPTAVRIPIDAHNDDQPSLDDDRLFLQSSLRNQHRRFASTAVRPPPSFTANSTDLAELMAVVSSDNTSPWPWQLAQGDDEQIVRQRRQRQESGRLTNSTTNNSGNVSPINGAIDRVASAADEFSNEQEATEEKIPVVDVTMPFEWMSASFNAESSRLSQQYSPPPRDRHQSNSSSSHPPDDADDQRVTTLQYPLQLRRYSIDLGVLSWLSRSIETRTSSKADSPLLGPIHHAAGGSSTPPISSLGRRNSRRTRTYTGNDNAAVNNRYAVITLYDRQYRDDVDELEEEQERGETTKQRRAIIGLVDKDNDRRTDTSGGLVKQPLSDIDRYSMIEGHIS